MDLNKVMIIGRLTRDPELRTTANGRSVASISVATNRVWTDQSGQKQEQVEYHNCVLWSKLADIAGKYLTKGRQAYFEGRLQTRDWVAQDGTKKFRTEIVVENMKLLDGPMGGGKSSGFSKPAPSADASVPAKPSFSGDDAKEEEIKVEDIPF